MGKYKLIFLILLLTFCSGRNLKAQQAEWQDIAGGNMHFSALWVNPDNQAMILAGSGKAVLKTADGGKSWRQALSVRAEVNSFTAISNYCLLAATANGLYLSSDQGNNWKRVFKGKNYLENECLAVGVSGNIVYLATKGGLFLSKDKCRSWKKEAGILANSPVFAITVNADNVYLASAQGIFKLNRDNAGWDKLFVSYSETADESPEETPEEGSEDTEGEVCRSYCLASDPNQAGHLYLANPQGIYNSSDGGRTWEAISTYGLFDKCISALAIAPDSRLFAAAERGIFIRRQDRWYEISLGLVAQDIRAIGFDKEGCIYAACGQGLFKARPDFYRQDDGIKTESLYFSGEPEIRQVQAAAIKYAEVEPEKIIRWRKQAARRAFFPRLTAGINRDTGDLWHWESGSTTKTADDALMRGRDALGWDVTLSWDLSEIIWNSDQTSIDSRSRLMVQLRDDILDEVTKLYFERIRVKAELDSLAIEERKKRFDKELRLRELTAMLDGLTNGYFSRPAK